MAQSNGAELSEKYSDLVLDKSIFKDKDLNTNLLENIPSLVEMIDTAMEKSPQIRLYYSKLKRYGYQMKADELTWLQNVNFVSDAKAGSYQNQALDELSLGYSYGIKVQLSLYDLVARKSKRNVRKYTMKSLEYEYEQVKLVLQGMVVAKYYDLLAADELFKIDTESKQVLKVNLAIAKKEYSIGETSISEYSGVIQMYNLANTKVLTSQATLIKSYKELELLVGKKFETFYRKY